MDTEPRAEDAAPGSEVKQWRTIPNLLSFARLVATPVLAWLIIRGHTMIAALLFGAMGATDDLGTTLDPVSDRVLALFAGVAMMSAHILPLALGIPVLLRDLVVSGAFLFLARRGFGKPKVRRVGKTATFALLSAMPALILGFGKGPHLFRSVGLVLFCIGGVLYYIAGYRYWQDVKGFLAHQRRPFGA